MATSANAEDTLEMSKAATTATPEYSSVATSKQATGTTFKETSEASKLATAATSEDTLEVLQLEKYYPQKLGYVEAIELRGTTEDDRCYGLMIIRRLLEMDHRALHTVTTKINKVREDIRRKESESKHKSKGTDEEKDEAVTKKTRKIFSFAIDDTTGPQVHPMDMMVTVFNCCDNFLRQMLVEKMFICRLAIPILLPLIKTDLEIMLLWGLNTIFLESKGTISRNISQPIIDIPNKIISFLRVSKLHRSKSKLLNVLLNESHHDTFYHRDCLNGPANRMQSNGAIEASWFLSDSYSDFSADFFTVLNLRGDSLELAKQMRFMCEQSSLVVVMVNSLDSFKKFHEKAKKKKIDFTKTRILLAFISNESLAACWQECTKYIENSDFMFEHIHDVVKDWIQERQMNQDEWKWSIKNSIRDFMAEADRGDERSLASIITSSKFHCDCHGQIWEGAKKKADEFIDIVKQEPFKHSRRSWCPLQGKPWMRLGELEREERRIPKKDGSREKFTAEIAALMKECREEQIERIHHMTEPILRFCQTIFTLEDISRLCFLKLTKINLDSISREIIPELTKTFQEAMANYRKLYGSSNGDFDDKTTAAEKQLSDASMGLEHIIREMGQMYEAVETQSTTNPDDTTDSSISPITKDDICKFPEIVAGLFLDGLPLEIMDGDACNVPSIWLRAVFDEIEKLIGKDKKVFVLSVIGVQSSGKSTFLNALFGLQFPVSAGRCTRGIYCHIVPMDTSTFLPGCDYILVVDSEGLRAPEFAGKSTIRDNELATLTVGLADVTIVNMKGENFSDMEDILQIVVHALIRIKQTKKDFKFMPSCVFVHQNVAAADAEDKIRMGKFKQLGFLDKMAKASADREGVREITAFKDVIKYEENLHSWYMPDLWNGQPPMATVNTEYSKRVGEVKSGVLKMITDKPICLTISKFYWRMSDLWNALLHDNFVFCFRNTGEILAHRSLDTKIAQVHCEMKSQNRRGQNIINNRITGCDNIELLPLLKAELYNEQLKILESSFKKAQKSLDDILREGEYKDILEQSREQYEKGFQKLADSEHIRGFDETRRIIEIHKKKLEKCQGVRDFEIKLLQLARYEAGKPKYKLLWGKELDDRFDKKWEKWTLELNMNYSRSRAEGTNYVKLTVESAINRTLYGSEELFYSASAVSQIGSLQYESIMKPFDKDPFQEIPYVDDGDLELDAYNESSTKDVHQKSYVTEANNRCRDVFCRVKLHIDEEEARGVDFKTSFVSDIIGEVGKFFGYTGTDAVSQDQPSDGGHSMFYINTPGYKFRQDYVNRFLIFTGRYAFDRLNRLMQEFILKTDPLFDITERYKPQLKIVFQNCLCKIPQHMTSADILANVFVNMAKRAVIKDLGRLILEKIGLSEKDKIFKSKHSFLTRILTDLAENGTFSDYIAYLETPETYFQEKIKTLLEEFLSKETSDSSTTSVLLELATNNLNDLLKEIKAHLSYATEKCTTDSPDALLSTFQESLQSKLLFQKNDYRLISDLGIGQLENFTKSVLERVEALQNEAVTSYREANETIWNELQKSEIDSVKELLDKILGCREKCPFCSAPCSATTQYHADSHRANHYPMGVGGTIDVPRIKIFKSEDIQQVRYVAGRYSTSKLVLETCHTLVESEKQFRSPATLVKYSRWWHSVFNWNYHPYTKYKDVYPEWDIPVDRSMNASLYWKWFMAKFDKELAGHYNASCPEIPPAWKDITKEQALKNLKNAA